MTKATPSEPWRGASKIVETVRYSAGGLETRPREIVVETPVAVVFDGSTAAVMMTSPADIRDFAYGFAVTEGFVSSLDEVIGFEEVAQDEGIEARFWLKPDRSAALAERRRAMMGPVGCGLCGIDSLQQATRDVPRVEGGVHFTAEEVATSTDLLRDAQRLHDRTRSAHAAGFLVPGQGIIAMREDVGRHNALDKLIGALILDGVDPKTGAVVMTSRVSVELIQKCAVFGAPALFAVSGPTSLAMETADRAGLTLAVFCRGDGFELVSHPERVWS